MNYRFWGNYTVKVCVVLTRIVDVTDGQINAQMMAKAYEVLYSDCNELYFRFMNGDALQKATRKSTIP